MARNAKEKDIIRFMELTEQIKADTEEYNSLRDMLIDDCIEYGTQEDNVFTITVGKSTAKVTVIIERRFNTKRFSKEHNKLYEQYREENTKNRVTATTERT